MLLVEPHEPNATSIGFHYYYSGACLDAYQSSYNLTQHIGSTADLWHS